METVFYSTVTARYCRWTFKIPFGGFGLKQLGDFGEARDMPD
jgi:hypothetical protein